MYKRNIFFLIVIYIYNNIIFGRDAGKIACKTCLLGTKINNEERKDLSSEKFISISFKIEWNVIVESFLLIMILTEFSLVHNH